MSANCTNYIIQYTGSTNTLHLQMFQYITDIYSTVKSPSLYRQCINGMLLLQDFVALTTIKTICYRCM